MNAKKLATFVLLLSPLLATAASAKPRAPRLPAFVRLSLEGEKLVDEKSYLKYDAAKHYYLLATGDCDGASVDLILTPNPKPYGYDPAAATVEDKQRLKRVTLPRLRTGSGVNIGDTPQQVRRKLGAAPRYRSYDRTTKLRAWVYNALISLPRRSARGPQRYYARYEFRNERLWAIHYNIASLHGCGED